MLRSWCNLVRCGALEFSIRHAICGLQGTGNVDSTGKQKSRIFCNDRMVNLEPMQPSQITTTQLVSPSHTSGFQGSTWRILGSATTTKAPTDFPSGSLVSPGPPLGFVKINFDGAVFSKENKSGASIVIWNREGFMLASQSRQFNQAYSPSAIEAVAAHTDLY